MPNSTVPTSQLEHPDPHARFSFEDYAPGSGSLHVSRHLTAVHSAHLALSYPAALLPLVSIDHILNRAARLAFGLSLLVRRCLYVKLLAESDLRPWPSISPFHGSSCPPSSTALPALSSSNTLEPLCTPSAAPSTACGCTLSSPRVLAQSLGSPGVQDGCLR